MRIILDKRFRRNANGRFGRYRLEVGILDDKPYRKPQPKSEGHTIVAGGPARRAKTEQSGKQLSEVSRYLSKNKNYLVAPFQKRDSAIIRLSKTFFDLCFGKTEAKRLVNMLQAIVRNPLTRNDYGPNALSTQRAKGFDRYGIDTGQLFKNIKARVKRV